MKARFSKITIAIVIISAFISGCSKRLDGSAPLGGAKTGEVYYAQFSFQYEKGRHLTTNYRRGILVPVNTPVQLKDMDSDEIDVEILPSHTPLRIVNVQKHTGDETTQAFQKMFAKTKVDLRAFSKKEAEAILVGKAGKGMNQKAVLAAIGYPPVTETPSLNSDQWTYWNSRFDRFIVYFENGRVSHIKD